MGGLLGLLKFGLQVPYFAKGMMLGFLISLSCGLLQFLYFEKVLKRFPFISAVLIRATAFSVLTVVVFFLVSVLISKLFAIPYFFEHLPFALVLTFIFASLFLFTISTINLIGRREFMSILTGRYHRPVEEERIFMFMDIASSTTIAEQLGHIRFFKFLNEFYGDVTEAVSATDGEIYKYVGDEAIVAWRLTPHRHAMAALDCYFLILKSIEAKRLFYEQHYGIVPCFRAGLHYGTVMVGELGDLKKEIAYIGDVLNSTARMQEECKNQETGILISKDVVELISDNGVYTFVSHGDKRLRGKKMVIEIFSVKEVDF